MNPAGFMEPDRVGVTVTVSAINLNGASSIDFTFKTAPINSTSFYTDLPTAVTLSVDTVGLAVFQSAEGFSRFFMLSAVPDANPSGTATLTATVDVIVRS